MYKLSVGIRSSQEVEPLMEEIAHVGWSDAETDHALCLEVEPGDELQPGLGHLRSHEINLDELRWPIAMITDQHDVMASLPGVRGTFEKRMDMVEHCHLRFEEVNYLLVKQFDEQAGEVLLLGGNRDEQRAEQLLSLLGVTDYMLP